MVRCWRIKVTRPGPVLAGFRHALVVTPFAAAIMCAAGFGSTARAAEPSFLTFGAGIYDFSDESTGVASVEYTHKGALLWKIKPMGGVLVTFDGALYGYGGFGLDIFFGRRIVLTPSLAVGLYSDGGGKDLGHVIEFRSAVKLGYRFDNRARVGIELYHLSNAGLDDINPGANALMLTYSMPLGRKP